jgi:hypothetical protein
MKKYIVLVATVVLAACGAESGSQKNSGGTDSGPAIGSVSSAAMQADTREMKVALKVNRKVYLPITTPNADPESAGDPVYCGTGGSCATGECDVSKNLCSTVSFSSTLFYVKNYSVPNPASPPSFLVPCDGRVWTAEIFGATNPTSGPYDILETHISSPFTMGLDCIATTGTVGGVVWRIENSADPVAVFPPIYVGMSDFNQFTVAMRSLGYPWGGAAGPWSIGGTNGTDTFTPVSYSGANATFAAPTSTAPITFTGVFHLDSSLLIGGETASLWERRVVYGPVTPFASIGMLPP